MGNKPNRGREKSLSYGIFFGIFNKKQQAVPSLPVHDGGRKVRAALGIMLPNGKISARIWQVEQKITAPQSGVRVKR
jgi:hypothetical protein